MIKEIKFRAWHIKDQKMIDWSLICQTALNRGECPLMYHVLSVIGRYHYQVMQFTGMKDKDGRDIYEGDLIRYEQSTKDGSRIVIGEVVYRKDLCCFQGLEKLQFENSYRILSADPYDYKNPNKVYFDPTVEVVGNVYENPNLIEKEGRE